ncbi:MAG: signal peptidase I [Puniceicoccales bacterium]|jgi:signal peptidase I|nr:signal peptidase I [Puniceicoccales bacterium]
MFTIFNFFRKNPLAEQRDTARALLRSARKVWHNRRDAYSWQERERFVAAQKRLADALEYAATATAGTGGTTGGEDPVAVLDAANNDLHAVLCELGGKIYPSRLIPEWVELIVVATFIACGVRSFFLQPFKIPTNSMWPTYHGMTAEVWPLDADGPGGVEKFMRKVRFSARRVEPRSPVAGEVLIPLDAADLPVKIAPTVDEGLFGTGLMRAPLDRFLLLVGEAGTPVEVPVPVEFTLQDALLRTYFPDEARMRAGDGERWRTLLHNARRRGDIVSVRGRLCVRTRKDVAAGGRVANFDVLTGDLVLVDRVTYNFCKPAAGDPFVFATLDIPGIAEDTYYIKRLVGTPGDTLRVSAPTLLRNGAPATGNVAFDANNARRDDFGYHGYLPSAGRNDVHSRPLWSDVKIPPRRFYAMGDNSANSSDSRAWGFVPDHAVVGRARFILYPFDNRWGLAK